MIKFQAAEKEYEKNPDIKKEEIDKLRDWMDKQPHLPKIDEVDLIVFYHSCYNSMEQTKITIDVNYTLKTHLDCYFKDRDPTVGKCAQAFDNLLFTSLKQRTPEGYVVLYCRIMDRDASHFHLESAAKAWVMVADLLQLEHGTFPGVVIVLDTENMVFGHLPKLTVMGIKTILYYLQEAMPVRLKGFHYVNTPPFMDAILALMKPFLKKQLLDILQLHSSPETLYKHVPKEAFPKDIGGNDDSFEKIMRDMKERMKANKQILMDREILRADESRRPGKPKNLGEIFGMEGSFKKLDID